MRTFKNVALTVTLFVGLLLHSAYPATEPNATPGSSTNKQGAYLKMGDFRLINNTWGAILQKCPVNYTIFINQDKSFGFSFNRAVCGGGGSKPDYPEVEFGVHPFGSVDTARGPMDSSSTTLLPLQIKDIKTASVKIANMRAELTKATSWNICFEMWLSQQHPINPKPGTYAELMTFWGWANGFWPCDKSALMTAGDKIYNLCHQSDNWGGWRYFQFRATDGPKTSFSGTLNVKAALDWLVKNYGYSQDLWVTRFEVGSEIDDNTIGKVTIDNITCEVNGVSKSPEFFTSNVEDSPVAGRSAANAISVASTLNGNQLHFTHSELIDNISIFSATGKIVLQKAGVQAGCLNVGRLPCGVYQLRIVDKKGAVSNTRLVRFANGL